MNKWFIISDNFEIFKKSIMSHKNIAKWNLAVASLIAISSIFFESIRVFALIVFVSALGIYVYHAFIKKDNFPINR